MDKLKFIKLIVFILTFLLVFGILIAAGTIYKKVSRPAPRNDIVLTQPQGSYIAEYRLHENKIYLLLKGGKISDRLAVIDPDSRQEPILIKIN